MDKIKEISKGYKKTSIGIIPEDWEIRSLKSQAYVDKENLNSNFNDEYINYVSLSDINNGKVYPKRIKFKEAPSRARRIAERGSVLLATVRPNLKNFALVDQDNIIASTGFAVLSKKKMDLKYLYNLLYSEIAEKQYFMLTVGSNYPALNSNDVKNLKLPIPSLFEQKVIADCLSTWDSGIEKLSALITAKKEQKKGLMQQLLTGKKRLDGFTEEWNPKRLNVIGKVNYGTRIVKGNVEEGDYFVYGGGGKTFTNKEYNREDCMVIARFAMSKECARFVKGKFYLNDSGLTIDANEKTNQSFLDYLLFYNQHNIYKLRAGGAQQNLDVQAFRGTALSIPTIDEQIAIAEVLTIADKEIELLEKKLEAFKIQKKGLMQVLLTGEKRLVDS